MIIKAYKYNIDLENGLIIFTGSGILQERFIFGGLALAGE
jgi:hypothetical protein